MKQLIYDKPASTWLEALPLGNGRLGAMIFGDPFKGEIQMNEESVVYGGPINRLNPDARQHLTEIRELIKAGKIKEAEDLEVYALSGVPQSQRPYQTMGTFSYQLEHDSDVIEDYERVLDIEKGIAEISYKHNGVTYKVTSFISLDEDVLVVKLEADKEHSISLSALLTRGRQYNCAGKAGIDSIYIDGDLGKGGSDFRVQAKAVASGGQLHTIGEHIVVKGANQVIFYIDGVTTFPFRKKRIEDCKEYLTAHLKKLTFDSYEEIKKVHLRKHSEVFQRSVLQLDRDSENAALPVDQRLARMKNGESDAGVVALYYNYSRYLLMSSSRPGGLPANLQGIWCEGLEPTWDSKYTININAQMNYWPAGICNLEECAEPFFDLLNRVHENGKVTAKEMYGCDGFVAHHNTDVWADTNPQDFSKSATYWVMGGAWLTTHIWQHYRYTMDDEFLKKMFPVIEDCVKFFLDFLIEDKGELVVTPSVSPENTYIMEDGTVGAACMGCTMDTALLRDIFSQYLKCIDVLNISSERKALVLETMEKLPPYQIGKYGQLMEWRQDYEEWEPGHRHFSHLYPLYPSNQINEYDSPELLKACEKSIERRLESGSGHTGWSCAWLINLYARLRKKNEAAKLLDELLTKLTADNLFDMHPPLERIKGIPWVFQIDGNFGALSGIAGLFLQSHLDEMFILPAIPDAWSDGKISGLCAEQGFVWDLEWREHRLVKGTLYSKAGKEAVIRSEYELKITVDEQEVAYVKDQRGRYVFATEVGNVYQVVIASNLV